MMTTTEYVAPKQVTHLTCNKTISLTKGKVFFFSLQEQAVMPCVLIGSVAPLCLIHLKMFTLVLSQVLKNCDWSGCVV